MKKKIIMVFMLFALLCICGITYYGNRHEAMFIRNANHGFCLSIKCDTNRVMLKPWYSEQDDTWYFFLPSHITTNKIWCGNLKETDLMIDGKPVKTNFVYENGSVYCINYQQSEYKTVFLTTSNISSLFVETASGNMDYIHEHKYNEESGKILSVDSTGNMEWAGALNKISGRGNSTWAYLDKKPYNLTLVSSGGLGGLKPAKKWSLLALGYDGDKIHSKLAFDIANILGGEYTSECTWVNLYLNGEYGGLYLLAEAVNGHEEFNNGQGNFLVEKVSRLDEEVIPRYIRYFETDNGNSFMVCRPQKITAEERDNIIHIFQNAESTINCQSEIGTYLDIDSFATQFLVDEISLNFDAFKFSAYIYIPAGENILYAGPAWDYDGAFGEYLHQGAEYTNPDGSVFISELDKLDWYEKLYATEEFYDCLVEKYSNALEELENLFTQEIDTYAAWIADSVYNDSVRWQEMSGTFIGRAGIYTTWENDVRYLKYFCINRLKALCERWQVESIKSDWTSSNEYHTVKFMVGDEIIYSLEILDGNTIDVSQIEELNGYENWNFFYEEEQWNEQFNMYLPILEDCTLRW